MTDDPFLHSGPTQSTGEGWTRRRLLAVVGAVAFAVSAVASIIALHQYAISSYYIPSSSMEPTLSVGDHVAVNRLAYTTGGHIQRGDIVLLDDSVATSRLGEPLNARIHFIKRVMAFENEEIRCCDDNGHVLVDGHPLAEEYLRGETTPFDAVRVPPGTVFVLGDNRQSSADSRVWGPLPRDSVSGKILSVRGTTARLFLFIVAGACALVLTLLALLFTLAWDVRRRRTAA
jgi:signal peptidase I